MSEWIDGWIRDGRLDTPDALANQDLWKQLVPLAQKHQISWQWVRGHAGHPFNERCDKLAKRAVDAGIQAANTPQTIIKEEKNIPETVEPEIDRVKDYSEFGTDDDGQLRLV